MHEPKTDDTQPLGFTPINRGGSFTGAVATALDPEDQGGEWMPHRHTESMKSPPEIKSGALKARGGTQKRQRTPTIQQTSHPSALETANTNSIRSYSVLRKPRSSRTSDCKAAAPLSTDKPPISIYSLSGDSEDCKILEPVWVMAQKAIPQTEINMKIQAPVGNPLSTPPKRTNRSSMATKKEPAMQKSKPRKRKSAALKQPRERPGDSGAEGDLVNRSDTLSTANFSTAVELSEATLNKLGHFRYECKPAVGHSTVVSVQASRGGFLSGAPDMIDNIGHPNSPRDCRFDSGDVVFNSTLPHVALSNNGNICQTSGTSYESFRSVNANITLNNDDDFGWDDCLDDAIVNQMDLMERFSTDAKQDTIPDPEKHGHHESTNRNALPELTLRSVVLQRPAPIYSSRTDEDPEIFSRSDLNRYINDEGINNIVPGLENLGNPDIDSPDSQPLYWQQALGSDSERVCPVVDAFHLVVDEAFTPTGLDEVCEDTALGTRAEERFFPPSSLNYAFDDNSQGMGFYGGSLRGSRPLTEERLSSENEFSICSSRHADLYSCDEGLVCAESTDQMSNVGDPAEPGDHSCGGTVGDGDEIFHLVSGSPTAADGGCTKKRRIHTPGSTNLFSSVASSNSHPAPNNLECDALGLPKRFVRPTYPTKVQDRSPIIGFSPKAVLRTCFRVGEALRDGSAAVRRGQDAVIELYARVVFSSRDVRWKQHFQFGDLFHDRPPFLSGSYEVFSGSELWDFDCRRFLGEDGKGKMCRCIGRMKRDGSGWKLVVLNIWEATWDDLKWVKGIVCA